MCIKCIFHLEYFQLRMGLTGYNPMGIEDDVYFYYKWRQEIFTSLAVPMVLSPVEITDISP